MDYQTKPTSRKDLRLYSKYLREIFNVPIGGPFPVLQVLERISDIFPNCNYAVLEDSKFSPRVMAQCVNNKDGGFTIEIRQTVYDGAYKGIGTFLGFICHEICHIFLFKIGFTPLFGRSFDDNSIPPYCSVEWQAKALCSEVMIPFEESKGMSVANIQKQYNVSKSIAAFRKKLDKKQSQ